MNLKPLWAVAAVMAASTCAPFQRLVPPTSSFLCQSTEAPASDRLLVYPDRNNPPLNVQGQQFTVPRGAVSDTVTLQMTVPVAADLRVEVEAVGRPEFRFVAPAELTMNYARCRQQQFGGDTIPLIVQFDQNGTVVHQARKLNGAPRAVTQVDSLSLFLLDIP